jgi:hypothetical protein
MVLFLHDKLWPMPDSVSPQVKDEPNVRGGAPARQIAITESRPIGGVATRAGHRVAGPRLGYRPALDGLRGVSVLAVMLHHSGLLEGGWLGVDVFFALSGFLITSLLLEEHERTRGISLRPFYARRALRLLPALLLLVGVCGVIMVAWSPPELFRQRMLYVVAVMLYAANWAMILGLPLYSPFDSSSSPPSDSRRSGRGETVLRHSVTDSAPRPNSALDG